MHGASSMNPNDLEIGDEVRLVCNEGAFTGTLTEADPVSGLTFMNPEGTEYIMSFMDIQEYDFYPKGKTITRLNDLNDVSSVENPLEDKDIPVLVETLDYFATRDIITIKTAQKVYVGIIEELLYADTTLRELDLKLIKGKEKNTVYTFKAGLLKISEITVSEEMASKIAERIENSKPASEITANTVDFFIMYEMYETLPPVESTAASGLQEKMEMCAGDDKELLEALKFITTARVTKIEDYIHEINAAMV